MEYQQACPRRAQEDFIRSIKGLEGAIITEFGYAVEYDFVDPRNLKTSLETKFLNNFYLAGTNKRNNRI